MSRPAAAVLALLTLHPILPALVRWAVTTWS